MWHHRCSWKQPQNWAILLCVLVLGAAWLGSPVQAQVTARNVLDSTFYLQLQDGSPLISFDTNDYLVYNRTNNTGLFWVNGNVALAVSPTGIGINTSSPQQALHVNGDVQLEATSGLTAGTGGIIEFKRTSDSWSAARLEQLFTGTGFQGVLTFSTNPGAIATQLLERMRLDQNGNLGIGTTAPGSRLTVRGGEGNHLELVEVGSEKSWDITTQAQDLKIVEVGSGDRLVIDATTGNVGIGTAPTAKLDVNGQIRIQGGSPGAGKVLTSDANGVASWQAAASGGGARDTAGNPIGVCAGRTTSGATSWVAYSGTSIYVDINTSACGFTATPIYFTTLTGTSNHFTATGMTSLYSATATGFRVYVSQPAGITPTTANNYSWAVNWVGMGN